MHQCARGEEGHLRPEKGRACCVPMLLGWESSLSYCYEAGARQARDSSNSSRIPPATEPVAAGSSVYQYVWRLIA